MYRNMEDWAEIRKKVLASCVASNATPDAASGLASKSAPNAASDATYAPHCALHRILNLIKGFGFYSI